jgi:hypothetical protein
MRIIFGLFSAISIITSVAYSETFTVTTDADTGTGSLREAITFANSNGEADEIVFAADYKIVVESPLPEITSMMVITGNGWGRSVITGGTKVAESNGGRVFSVARTGRLILDGVMLRIESPTPNERGVSNDGEFVFRNSRAERKLYPYAGPGDLYFDQDRQTVSESDGSATIGVTRWDGDEGVVSATYSTSDGTAIEGIDYNSASGDLEWADGDDGKKTFDVEVINNSDSDGERSVVLELSDPTGGVSVPSPGQLIITDDEGGTGPCVQDLENGTVCLRDGRFEIIGTWTDFENPANTQDLIWTPVENINATAGFQNNPSGIQIVMRVADGCPLTGTWWVWLGGFTDAGWDITVRDTVTGNQRNFSKPRQGGVFPTTERDSINFACE